LNVGPSHAPCFSAGQLLATRVAQFIAEGLHAPLAILSPTSEQLFKTCESASWPQLERSKICVDFATNVVELLPVDQASTRRAPIIVTVELRPLIVGLREKLLETDVEDQSSLAFPPMVAGGRQ
jgi:hypothetical protein